MIKIASLWGLLSGTLFILLTWFTLTQRHELNTLPGWGLYSRVFYIVILGIVILFSMRTVRNKVYAEQGINFGQTFYVGIVTALVTGVLFAIFSFSYIQFIEPDISTKLAEEIKIEMTKYNQPAQDIDVAVKQVSESYTPSNQFFSSLIGTSIMGIICSALLAVFVRNRDTFSQ